MCTRAVAEAPNMSVCGGFPGEIVGRSNFSGRIPRLASPRPVPFAHVSPREQA